jgi:hypothetical protein
LLWLNTRSKNRAPAASDRVDEESVHLAKQLQDVRACENFPIAFKSSAAPMSPTTQQVQHSPNRHIKSMSFIGIIDINIIYFMSSIPRDGTR